MLPIRIASVRSPKNKQIEVFMETDFNLDYTNVCYSISIINSFRESLITSGGTERTICCKSY